MVLNQEIAVKFTDTITTASETVIETVSVTPFFIFLMFA